MNVIFLSSKIISEEYKMIMKLEKIKKHLICSLAYLTKKGKKIYFLLFIKMYVLKSRIVTEVDM